MNLMRTEYIMTKVRPIKRMFVIEPTDIASFRTLFLAIQKDIDVIFNLIFVNDAALWTPATGDFVKRSDPDIILNYSLLKDQQLSDHFGIDSVDPRNEHFKTERYSTDLFSFTRRPPFFDAFEVDPKKPVTAHAGKELKNEPLSFMTAVNYGIFTKGMKSHLRFSIFKNLRVNYLSGLEGVIGTIRNDADKFINLTREIGSIGGSGYGSSVYYAGYNREHYFSGKKTWVFVSAWDDLRSVCYFWNTRSYYSSSRLRWIPVELLASFESIVDPDTVFVTFDDRTEATVKKTYKDHTVIRPEHLHFDGEVNRWAFLEHEQTITITDDKVNIHHPAEKSLSAASSIGACVLEIRNLSETIFRKHRNAGDLFFPPYYEKGMMPDRFLRLSEHGLSKYVFEFSVMKAQDIVETIYLPSYYRMVAHLFQDQGLQIRKTSKSSIIEQTINLMGGVNELRLLSRKPVFDLIVAMTPQQRTEKVAARVLKDAAEAVVKASDIMDLIAEIRESGALSYPAVILTVEEMQQKAHPLKPAELNPILQHLYDSKILLRGKYFECRHCGSKLWLPIAEINRTNYCPDCSNPVNIPVFKKDKQDSDNYRLNQLLVRAVDQGQLSTILPLNLFYKQQYNSFEFLANIEVLAGDKVVTDIDLLIKIWKRTGFIECKTLQAFTERQVKDLTGIARKLKCDFIGFSSLHTRDSEAVADLISLLEKETLDIPAFIFTAEALFAPRERMIQRYFETGSGDTFPTGPILIS